MQYGLIGYPLGHSHSPFVHTPYGYDYVLHELPEKDLAHFLKKKNFLGINVTIPHKKAVIPYLDDLDETAKRCGAVNTIVNKCGRLIGYNTDVYGMEYALSDAGISLKDKNVIILGSGGTSNTACALSQMQNAKSITVVSRTGKINYGNVYTLTDTDVIINATPVGMYPNIDAQPIDLSLFPHLTGVFDAIYNPLNTRLIQSAKDAGIPHTNGLKMLVAQAKKAAEIFTGKSYDNEIIEQTADKLYKKLRNVVLIGMPGAGKTTIGKMIAKSQKRDFFDLDKEIERRENATIPDIFDKHGESYFRKVEREVCAQISKKQGIVIASGGGIVLDRENINDLRANGTLIWLKRDITKLPRDGRPLSKSSQALTEMYSLRAPLYSQYADIEIQNDDIKVAVKNIEKQLKL